MIHHSSTNSRRNLRDLAKTRQWQKGREGKANGMLAPYKELIPHPNEPNKATHKTWKTHPCGCTAASHQPGPAFCFDVLDMPVPSFVPKTAKKTTKMAITLLQYAVVATLYLPLQGMLVRSPYGEGGAPIHVMDTVQARYGYC